MNIKVENVKTKIPSVIQLPRGRKLEAIKFRVTEYNPDGSPKMFQLLEPGDPSEGKGIWWFFGEERQVRRVVPEELR